MQVLRAAQIDYLPCVCKGQLQCSTCHVKVLDDDQPLPNDITSQAAQRLAPPSIEELDMLDIAADVSNSSRLACQLTVGPHLDGATLRVPELVSNYMDDFEGTPVPAAGLKRS
jgi:ferredoxin